MLVLGGVLVPHALSAQVARAYAIVDHHTRYLVEGYNVDKKFPVASLTKVATAMVVLDWAERIKIDMNTRIVVPPSAGAIGGANPVGMRPGDAISLRDALYCALMASDNVSAETVAYFVGRDLLRRGGRGGDPVGYFVQQMNALAKQQGARKTKFTNPHGLDHLKPVGYSSAGDMARMTIYALNRSAFTFLISQKARQVTYYRGGAARTFNLKNTNKLLGVADIDGVKTGMTRKAGGCLIVSAKKKPLIKQLPDGRTMLTKRRLIVVVLGSGDRFGVASRMLSKGWEKYEFWLDSGRPVEAGEILSAGS